MKQNISLLFIALITLFAFACNKGTVVTYPDDANQGFNNTVLTYGQISGTYHMYDSIYYIGNEGYQPIDPQYKRLINASYAINVGVENGVGAFNYHGLHFVESRGVQSEYIAYDPNFDITKIWFRQDSIMVNYLKRSYRNDSCLNITVFGYKVK